MSEKLEEWTISYKQIGIILISFVLGLVVALLLSNSNTAVATNFTTTELIGFVLSVILSGASIVLAIAAIALGKSSELAIINRSDESIRIQTEVYTRTTDALQSIKSSTGVTEKRIEDIISGRAGDLSRKIAEIATDETSLGKINVKDLEEKIKRSITGTFEKDETEEERKLRAERREQGRKQRQEYEKHHDELLHGVANRKDTIILKIGHGNPLSGSDEEFSRYDAVFLKGEKRIAFSTFIPLDESGIIVKNIGDIINNLVLSLEPEKIEKLYLFFFEVDSDFEAIKYIKQKISLMKESLASKIEVITIPYSESAKWSAEHQL